MSEIRQDWASGAWTIIAPERADRHGGRPPDRTVMQPAGFDPACPFCPGNERQLAGIIEESSDGGTGWRTRVVPNKYPALQPGGQTAAPGWRSRQVPKGLVRSGLGAHEVIIESPRHDADLATMPEPELRAVMQAYHRRYTVLADRPGMRAVLVFRNHGHHAGATIAHPHAQVIATAMVPPHIAARGTRARAHLARSGRCIGCDELAFELQVGTRIVEATDRFALFVPFAAACPFELRILPRRHMGSFGGLDSEGLTALGRLLQRALRRLRLLLDAPPYNFVVESGAVSAARSPWCHWRLRIVPNLTTPAGFELGAGMAINPSRPESDAEALRATAI